jgi:hypothetical protein
LVAPDAAMKVGNKEAPRHELMITKSIASCNRRDFRYPGSGWQSGLAPSVKLVADTSDGPDVPACLA